MKLLLLTLLLGYCLVGKLQTKANDENFDGRMFSTVLNDNLRRKCLKIGNETIYEIAMEKRRSCSTGYSKEPEIKTDEDLVSLICTELPCETEFYRNIDTCLGTEEKFIYQFLAESNAEHCENDGQKLSEKLKGFFDAECEGSPKIMVWYATNQICDKKLRFMHHKSEPDFIWTVSDMCSDINTYQNCIVEVVLGSCGGDEFVKYATVFLEPYLDWCEKNSNNV